MGVFRSRARVAHVIAAADFGGAESVVRSLAAGRHDRGMDTRVAVLIQHDRPSPLIDALERAGVPVAEIRSGHRQYGRQVRALEQVLRSWGTTLVHSHVYHADHVAFNAARRTAIPIVSTVHGFSGGSVKNRLFEWYDRQLLRRFDRVICVSDAQRPVLEGSGVRPERIRVVGNGLAAPAFVDQETARRQLGLPADRRIIGWVGRLSAEKGPDQFVDALRALARVDVLGAMIGDGPERGATEASIAANGTDVVLLGRVPDAARMLRAFDVIALTSRTEGAPIVLLEAMAAGVPVVCFAVGGVPKTVDDVSSWLVSPGDIDGMARALRQAIDDPAEAKRRASAASGKVDSKFGIEPWLAAVEAVYDEALAPK